MSELNSPIPVVEKPEEASKPTLKQRVKERLPKFGKYKNGQEEPREVLEEALQEPPEIEDVKNVEKHVTSEQIVGRYSSINPDVEYQKELDGIRESGLYPKTGIEALRDRYKSHHEKEPEQVDGYDKRASAADKVKRKFLEVEARRQGITDVKTFNEVVDYFEREFTDYKSVIKNYKKAPSQEEQDSMAKKWREEGWDVYFRSKDDGTFELTRYKHDLFKVGKSEIPVIKAMLETGQNPVPIIQALKEAGIQVNRGILYSYNLLEGYNSDTREFIDMLSSPNLNDVLDFIHKTRDIPKNKWQLSQYGEESAISEIRKMAESGTLPDYPDSFYEDVGVIAVAMGRRIDVNQLPMYEEFLLDSDKVNFLSAAVLNGYFPQDFNSEVDVFKSIDLLKQEGLFEPLITLMSSRIELGQIFETGVAKYGQAPINQQEINAELKQFLIEEEAQAILQNKDKQEFSQIMSRINERKVDIIDVNRYFPKRKEIIAMCNLVFSNEKTLPYSSSTPISKAAELVGNRMVTEVIFSSDFQAFLRSIQKDGMLQVLPEDFKLGSLYDSERGIFMSNIIGLYEIREIVDLVGEDSIQDMLLSMRDASKSYKRFEKWERYGEFIKFSNIFSELKKCGVHISKDKLKDATWISHVEKMPLLGSGFSEKIPQEFRDQWVNAVVNLPLPLQTTLLDSFRGEDSSTSYNTENTDRLVQFAKLITESDFLSSEYVINDPGMYEMYSSIGRYEGNLQDFFEEGKPTKALVDYLLQKKFIQAASVAITDDVITQYDPSASKVLSIWKSLPDDLKNEALTDDPAFPEVSQEKLERYEVTAKVIDRIRTSPSAEVKRLEKELIEQLWRLKDPTGALEEIISIFEKNNLPPVGKIYRVFEAIYDNPNTPGETILEATLRSPHLSPVLRGANRRQRQEIIYRDLLKVHVESGNPQLRNYLEVLKSGEVLMGRVDMEGVEALSERERLQITHFLNKMDMLYQSSLFGRSMEDRYREKGIDHVPTTSHLDISERIAALKKNFRVRSGQRLTDRVSEMFLKPLGAGQVEEVLAEMDKSKATADRRNREYVSANDTFQIKAGDRFKGVNSSDFSKILESGAVAREYLGSGAGSDTTPYDTDTSLILNSDIEQDGFQGAVSNTMSKAYGDIMLLVRDRGQFGPGKDQYESFSSGGKRHYGIRTGIASTEIDGIVLNTLSGDENKDSLFILIAQNGFYIPVSDTDGKIIFTPQDFDSYRKAFDGVNEYGGNPMSINRVGINEGDYSFPNATEVIGSTRNVLDSLKEEIKTERGKVNSISSQVRERIRATLLEHGVNLRGEFDTSIYGAELIDTGSTSRGTNIPGEQIDFDLSLQLDPNDSKRLGEVAQAVKSTLKLQEDKSHGGVDYIQIRAIGAEIIEGEKLDIDVGVGRRADYGVFASSESVSQKLLDIKERMGDEVYEEVLANIVLVKKVLKEGHAYKKLEDGGMGGIGIENWILLNNGNILDAFQSFLQASQEDGATIPYGEFVKRYKVFDAGTNIKYNTHDNFIRILKPEGYQKMVGVIGQYLGYV